MAKKMAASRNGARKSALLAKSKAASRLNMKEAAAAAAESYGEKRIVGGGSVAGEENRGVSAAANQRQWPRISIMEESGGEEINDGGSKTSAKLSKMVASKISIALMKWRRRRQ
jgi:hypothetical protein